MALDAKYILARMNNSHLPELMKLKELALWNQIETDWSIFIDNYADHAFVVTKGTHVVGSAAAINYQNKAAWIGMVLVHPEHRKRGIASELMQQVIVSLQACQSIKLDATPSGRKVYLNLGFEDEEEIIRLSAKNVTSTNLNKIDTSAVISADHCSKILDIDQNIFKCDRSILLKTFYNNQTAKSYTICNSEKIEGFCLGRQGSEYYQIGPVGATSPEAAKKLISKALHDLSNENVILDVPTRHLPELDNILSSAGFVRQRSFIRMYLNANHQINWNNYYVCAGPEFG